MQASDANASQSPAVISPASGTPRPQVVVVICCYNSRQYLPDCLSSLLASAQPDLYDLQVIAVDNASPDDSAAYIQSNFPQVHLLRLSQNLGFAGGNNAGWQYSLAHFPQAEYLVLLNHDTIVDRNWLAPLIEHLQQHPQVGCVQPKILLHPATDTINTAGNRTHYLGFGYMTGYGQKDDGRFDTPTEIDFPSGCAVMIRAGLLFQTGLFDDLMFAYLEDADLAWRMALQGKTSAYVPASRVYHKYEVKAPFKAYYLLERNRWWMLLTCYRWRTLLLLLPALLFMEAGQWFFAMRQGLLRERLRVYGFFLRPRHWKTLRIRRHHLQRTRLVSDRKLSERFTGVIHFEAIDHVLLRRVANPVLNAWWKFVRKLLHW